MLEAQDRRFSAGAILGLNASQIQGDDEAGYTKLGLMGGLSAQILFTEKTELGIELLYSQLGSRSRPNDNPFFEGFKSRLNYVSIPVYYSYKDWLEKEEGEYYKLHFLGGLSYGRLFSSEVEGSPFVQAQDFFKEDYLGILFGATFYLNKHWGIGARWERGLLRLYTNDLDNPNQPNLERPLWDLHLTFYATYSL